VGRVARLPAARTRFRTANAARDDPGHPGGARLLGDRARAGVPGGRARALVSTASGLRRL